MIRPICAMAIVLSATNALGQSTTANVCLGILEYASRDETQIDSDLAIAQYIYRRHCEGNTIRRDSALGVGIEAVIKAVPAKFLGNASQNEQKLNQFCKIAVDQNILNQSTNIKHSIVVREALESFNSCVQNASNQVYFDPKIQRTQFVIDVKRGVDKTWLSGLSYDKKVLKCTYNTEGKASVADENTRIELNQVSLPVTCERIPQPSDGKIVYPRAEIIINSDRTSFAMTIPREESLNENMAGNINRRISELESKMNDLERHTRLDCERITSKSGPVRNAMHSVEVPKELRSTHVVTGGSCQVVEWQSGHRPAALGGGLQNEYTWGCLAGDAPGQAITLHIISSVTFCRVNTTKP